MNFRSRKKKQKRSAAARAAGNASWCAARGLAAAWADASQQGKTRLSYILCILSHVAEILHGCRTVLALGGEYLDRRPDAETMVDVAAGWPTLLEELPAASASTADQIFDRAVRLLVDEMQDGCRWITEANRFLMGDTNADTGD